MRQVSFTVDTADAEAMMQQASDWMNPSHMGPVVQDAFTFTMRKSAAERFGTESNNGERWEPLHPATIRRRQELGYGAGPINQRTGRMMMHLIRSEAKGGSASGGVEYEWPESAQGELALKLARAQGYDPNEKVPARPVIGMAEDDLQYVLDRMQSDLEEFVK